MGHLLDLRPIVKPEKPPYDWEADTGWQLVGMLTRKKWGAILAALDLSPRPEDKALADELRISLVVSNHPSFQEPDTCPVMGMVRPRRVPARRDGC